MLLDAASSAVSDVGRHWGHNPRSLRTYRKRLLAVGLITSVGRGRVAFADTTIRRCVEAQSAAEGFVEPQRSSASG